MTRHIADHDRGAGSRLGRFTAIARKAQPEGSHPAAKAALRKPAATAENRRLREFIRIARGHLA